MTAPRISPVLRRLAACYGRPPTNRSRPLMDVLIQTILSQNTSDANSLRAFAALKKNYPDWSRLAGSSPGRVAKVIKSGGLANIKSRRILELLRSLSRERGKPDLEWLRGMEPESAYEFLKGLKGVGPKTAACTLLFGAGIPIFPVDTHIYRVAKRLGWVRKGEDRERFQERFRHLVPPGWVYVLHLNLIEHGRRRCHSRNPRCQQCCLKDHCLYHKERI